MLAALASLRVSLARDALLSDGVDPLTKIVDSIESKLGI